MQVADSSARREGSLFMSRIILFMAFMHQPGAFWRYSPWIMARASRAFSLFSEGCGGIGADVGFNSPARRDWHIS
jgi:hypothetical protein